MKWEKIYNHLILNNLGGKQFPPFFSRILSKLPFSSKRTILEYLSSSLPLLQYISEVENSFKILGGDSFKELKNYSRFFDMTVLFNSERIFFLKETVDVVIGSFLFSTSITSPLPFLREINKVLKKKGQLILLEREKNFLGKFLFSFYNLDFDTKALHTLFSSVLNKIEEGRKSVLGAGSFEFVTHLPFYLRISGFTKLKVIPVSSVFSLIPPYSKKDNFLIQFLKKDFFSQWLLENKENYFFGGGGIEEWEKILESSYQLEKEIKEKVAKQKLILNFYPGLFFYCGEKN